MTKSRSEEATMAKLQHLRPRIVVDATITLDYAELKALDALTGYGVEKLIEHFYQHMGRAYLEPYEHGFRSFLEAASGASGAIRAADQADKDLQQFRLEKGRAVANGESHG
jgi:hypothetical protein